jgi:probable rRNA maturation factor
MKIKIYFSNKQNKLNAGFLLRSRLSKAIAAALKYEGFDYPCEISLTFVDNEGIREMNREYRGKDSSTDVLSFPMYEFCEGETLPQDRRIELGDIVVSLEKAKEQSVEFGHSYERESAFLCVHSVLHLLGYDHERSPEDEEDMCRRQREIMIQLGYKMN